MAGRIAGITIEIGGDTTKLQSALKGVDKQLKSTQSNLKDINKLLKLDPGNTELLTQKQKNLQNAIKATKDRLAELKNAQSQVKQGTEEWDALQREIIATEQDLQGLEKELKNFGSVAAQQVAAAGQKVQEFGNKVSAAGNALKPLSTAAGGLVTGIAGLGYKAVTTADDLNTLAKQTGLSTAEIQKMQYASDLIDVSFDDISGALRKMKPKMDESNETFKALGVAVTDSEGNLRSVDAVFYDSVKALSAIENETERDQVAMDLFGKSADSLAGIIDDGGAALRDYGEEAENMGLILSQDTLDALNETNDKIDQMKANLKGAFLGLGATSAEALAPVVEKIAEGIGKLTTAIQNLTPEQMKVITTIAAVVAAVAPVLIVGGKIISIVGKIMTLAPVLRAVIAALTGPVGIVIGVIGALVAAGVLLYKNWDHIKAVGAMIWNDLKTGWEDLKNSVVTTVTNIVSSVTEKFNALRDKAKTAFDNLVTAVKNAVEKIKAAFSFKWQLPQLKLPHLSISYEPANSSVAKFFGISEIPHLSVQWYRSAYDNPVMFTSPTVLNTPYGPKGFGDGNGAEVVIGIDKLRDIVGADRIIEALQDLTLTADVVLEGDAKRLFKVVRNQNQVRTTATNYNILAAGV